MMTYRIDGLAPDRFRHLFALDDAALAQRNAMRVRATTQPGFPCRVTLEDAPVGQELILLNFVSHDVATPYRMAYAIYVSEQAAPAPSYVDGIPPVFAGRTIGLRGFDEEGMLRAAALAGPGEADDHIRGLFARDDLATIHAHNAAHGCFLAQVVRA